MADQLSLIWHQYRIERKVFWRNPSAAFFNFLLPLFFLLFFGAIAAHDDEQLEILVPGIAAMSVMSTTFTALAFNMTFLREQGVLKRMRGTPLPSGSYLAAIGLNAITNTILQLVLITTIGRALFDVSWPNDVFELVVFAAAGVLCFAALGVALSHAIPNFESAPAYVNAFFLPMIMISGVFYDADHVPQVLRDIAEALPLKHLVDGLSSAMVSGKGLGSNTSALGVIGIWAAFGLWFAVRGFSWDQRRA
jgi:ABC-2 type transport system permease protein